MRQVVPEHLRGFLEPSQKGISLSDRVSACEAALRDVLARLEVLDAYRTHAAYSEERSGPVEPAERTDG